MNFNRNNQKKRRGATTVETAIVLPLVVLFLFGLLVFQMATFRRNQIAWLSQESSRYASVHGPEFSKQFGRPIATVDEVRQNVIRPNAYGLDLKSLTLTLDWQDDFRIAVVTIEYPWGSFITNRTLKCISHALVTF